MTDKQRKPLEKEFRWKEGRHIQARKGGKKKGRRREEGKVFEEHALFFNNTSG